MKSGAGLSRVVTSQMVHGRISPILAQATTADNSRVHKSARGIEVALSFIHEDAILERIVRHQLGNSVGSEQDPIRRKPVDMKDSCIRNRRSYLCKAALPDVCWMSWPTKRYYALRILRILT